MNRLQELKAAICRAQDRARYARRELDRHLASAVMGDEEAKRATRKLEADLTRAENDEAILRRSLREASKVAA